MSTLAYTAPNPPSALPAHLPPSSPLDAARERVISTGEPVVVEQQGHPTVVMMSLQEYESIQETAYLLSSAKNARLLFEAIEQVHAGKTRPRELLE